MPRVCSIFVTMEYNTIIERTIASHINITKSHVKEARHQTEHNIYISIEVQKQGNLISDVKSQDCENLW